MEQVIPGSVIVVALFGLVLLHVRSRRRAEESQQERLRHEEQRERGVPEVEDHLDGALVGRAVDLDSILVALVFTCPADQVASSLTGARLPKHWRHNQAYEWYFGPLNDRHQVDDDREPDAIAVLEPTVAGCRLSLVSTAGVDGAPAHGDAWAQLRRVITRRALELGMAVDELPGPLLAPLTRAPESAATSTQEPRWVRVTS